MFCVQIICNNYNMCAQSRFLTPSLGTIFGSSWRRWSPDMEGRQENIEYTVMGRWHIMILQLEVGWRANLPMWNKHIVKHDERPWTWTDSFKWPMQSNQKIFGTWRVSSLLSSRSLKTDAGKLAKLITFSGNAGGHKEQGWHWITRGL